MVRKGYYFLTIRNFYDKIIHKKWYKTCLLDNNNTNKYITTAICTTYRAPRIKTFIKPGCVICKHSQCIDERKPEVDCKVNPDMYHGPVTRSLSKLIDSIQNFIIIETYRCMPLLGDEQENVPDWDVHIVRYSIVFVKHTTAN